MDLGRPLWADTDRHVDLPRIDGLVSGDDPDLLGVLISHSHPDHYGLVDQISSEVPLYAGEATARVLNEAAFFTPAGLDRNWSGYLADRESFDLGPFRVTPYLVDHSAFDSYALLVEAEGQSLFYSGDIRAHGRKAAIFERLVSDPPQAVDSLLLEGTTIARPPAKTGSPDSEAELEDRLVGLISTTGGAALVCYSPQNIDRMVSVFKAAIRSDRALVLDLYGASIAAASGKNTIPQADWERVRVYVPQSQRVKVKNSKEFHRVAELGPNRIYAKEIAGDLSKWVMNFRPSMMPELEAQGCLEGAQAFWLMWSGYLEGEKGERTKHAFVKRGIDLTALHTSGHARVEDLIRLEDAIGADKVVPIHTDSPDTFASLFKRASCEPDGKWWRV